MFLHLSVILFTGGHAWQGVCVGGGMHGREHVWLREGACMAKGQCG